MRRTSPEIRIVGRAIAGRWYQNLDNGGGPASFAAQPHDRWRTERTDSDESVKIGVESSTREMLNSRYDDLKSGRVKPISGADVMARLKAKSS